MVVFQNGWNVLDGHCADGAISLFFWNVGAAAVVPAMHQWPNCSATPVGEGDVLGLGFGPHEAWLGVGQK